MNKGYDLAKTQFLATTNAFTGRVYPTKAYRRKRASMMFDRDGRPMRLMTWDEWLKFKSDWPKEVEEDGLTLKTVWTLEEIKP